MWKEVGVCVMEWRGDLDLKSVFPSIPGCSGFKAWCRQQWDVG